MTDSPWNDERVAREQRALVDQQIANWNPRREAHDWRPVDHFDAFVSAVRMTNCPGAILEIGCGSGYNRELLDRAVVEYTSYWGDDISRPAIAIAKERYPESRWNSGGGPWEETHPCDAYNGQFEIVIDGCVLLHSEDWRTHLTYLCMASRRWVILHRVPIADVTHRTETRGYGKSFPAWSFKKDDIDHEMNGAGFEFVSERHADGNSLTMTYARPRHFVTYFDSNYWPRARAMWRSLQKHSPGAVLHALCWDDDAAGLAAVDGFHVYQHFLTAHPELAIDKLPGPPRTRVEHMWTVGPQYIADVMKQTGEPVTYLDADTYFFSSPEPIFAALGNAAAGIVPHGFPLRAQGLPGVCDETHAGSFGRYNVGHVYFNDVAVAQDWADECRRWCYSRIAQDEKGRWYFGDQKYLEDWPAKFGAVVLPPHTCVGPWGIHSHALDVRDKAPHFGNKPLVAYHFSGVKTDIPHGMVSYACPEYQVSERQIGILYKQYLNDLLLTT